MNQSTVADIDQRTIDRFKTHLPHALLIVGEKGLDTEGAVDTLARSEPSDIVTIHPEEGRKSISVDQVRQLTLRLRTYPSRRRVVTINPASAMTEEAQNALLKLLEEPAERTHLLLVATLATDMLPTVRSRCQLLTLSRTTQSQDSAALADADVDDKTKQQILFLAAGRPMLIRELTTDSELLDTYRQTAADAKKIVEGVSYQALQAVHTHSTSRESALRLVDTVTTLLRFRTSTSGFDKRTEALLERVSDVQTTLEQNGHVKLSLLQLAVRP